MIAEYAIATKAREGWTKFILEVDGYDPAGDLIGTIDTSQASTSFGHTFGAGLTKPGDVIFDENGNILGVVRSLTSSTGQFYEPCPVTYNGECYPGKKLPIYQGSVVKFELSKDGFGYLNMSYDCGIVDTDSFDFAELFELNFQAKSRLVIFLGFKELFTGYTDLNLSTRATFPGKLYGYQTTFYSGPAFLRKRIWANSGILAVPTDMPVSAGDAYARFDRVFNKLYFEGTTTRGDQINYVQRWEQTALKFNDAPPIQPYQLMNELWIRKNSGLFDIRTPISTTALILSKSFFSRFGYSYTFQGNAFVQVDAGNTGSFNRDVADLPLVEYDTDYTVRTITRSAVNNPEIETGRVIQDALSLSYLPFSTTRYRRKGPSYTGLPNDITFDNPIFADKTHLEAYNYPDEIPFDPHKDDPGSSLPITRVLVPVTQSLPPVFELSEPVSLRDTNLDSNAYDITELNARLHMRLREFIRPGLRFAYIGILDPMLPHSTDFDPFVYNLWRGEWDVIDLTTNVLDSTAISELS